MTITQIAKDVLQNGAALIRSRGVGEYDVKPLFGQFIGTRDGRNTFNFLCPACESEGEIGVIPNERRLVQCPNECGALFVQRRPKGLFAHPELVYVTGGTNSGTNSVE